MTMFLGELSPGSQSFNAILAGLLPLIIIPIIFTLFSKVKKKRYWFILTFFIAERWAFAVFCSLILFYLFYPFNQNDAGLSFQKAILIGIIIAGIWFSLRIISMVKKIVYELYPVDKSHNLMERKVRTQFQYIQYIFSIIIVVIGVGLILWQFENLRILGTGLLASAGIVGIIIAFAAQQSLGNLLAGFQIAFTQPFRIDDVVIVEGEWGRIEEITLTYVVVRIWDQRRLVLPISYFINNPFENWTRTTADIWGTVFMYVDYTIPVEEVRKHLQEIVKTTDLWDGNVVVLQVTNTTEKTMELRALVSARNASDAWSLRCYVREQLIEYMQKQYPQSLPRIRLEEKTKQKMKKA